MSNAPLVRRFGIALVLIVIGGFLAFLAGFNFHAAERAYFTSGFRADWGFFPGLLRAFVAVKQREPSLADPQTLQAELLNDLRRIRVGIYRPASDYKIPVRDGLAGLDIPTAVVAPGTPASDLLKSYDVLIFPQGGYRLSDFPPGEGDRLREAVASGLGYIGICAGMIFAARDLQMVDAQWRPLAVVGLVPVRTVPGSFWDHLGNRSFRMHFAGGGYFVANNLGRWEPLIQAENLGVLAIWGRFGRGKVVLFTAHPEGGGLTLNNQSVYFSGSDLNTGSLLLQAILKSAPEAAPDGTH